MAEKPKKPQKLKARLPRGLEDRGPAAINATRQMVETIRAVYERYGFEPVETPAFEYTDALGKFLPDQDRPNEGVFSFQDDDEQWISLRYDLTAPLARYVAENFDSLPKPYRSYRAGYVYRNEKPGPGRFRQFMQFDADTVGSPTMAADAKEKSFFQGLEEVFRQKGSEIGVEGLKELSQIFDITMASGYGDGRVNIDTSVVRGLEYYTGPVYEVELTLETKDEKGRPVRFGSVGGGGRYDGLVSRFRGEPVPATGFSIGVSRLQAALTMLGKIDTTPGVGPAVVPARD